MPAVVGQANAVAAGALVSVWRRAAGGPGEPPAAEHAEGPLIVWQRAVVLGALGWCVVSPFFAARSKWVVLTERSPLWAYPLQGLVTVPVSAVMMTALIAVLHQARDEQEQNIGPPSELESGSESQ